jgi:hypothetical protein
VDVEDVFVLLKSTHRNEVLDRMSAHSQVAESGGFRKKPFLKKFNNFDSPTKTPKTCSASARFALRICFEEVLSRLFLFLSRMLKGCLYMGACSTIMHQHHR